jgi:cell division protein FtsB
VEIKETQEQLRKLLNENKELSEQVRTLNENLRRESE